MIVGNTKNAGNQNFLLFLQCFLPLNPQVSDSPLCCHLQVLSISISLKFCCFLKAFENIVGQG